MSNRIDPDRWSIERIEARWRRRQLGWTRLMKTATVRPRPAGKPGRPVTKTDQEDRDV